MKLFSWLQDSNPESQSENGTEPISPVLQSRLNELEKMSVREVMIPRSVVMALDVDVQLRRVRRLKSSKTAYFPVYKGDLDHVLGWVSKQKVLELLGHPADDVQLSRFLRPVGVVSEEASVADLSDVFLQSASPFLVVKNAQGSTVGLVQLVEFVELVFGFQMGEPAQTAAQDFSGPQVSQYDL